jgi:amylo-alpha-1,6-glucosidase
MIAKPEGSLIQPPAVSAAILASFIDFGRETCCSLDVACDREWPVTNGTPLTADQQRAVVDACARHLLTSYGLRSLAPGHANYQAHYRGGPRERDAAYHQGTVWGWPLGPFVQAHLRVYRDPIRAAAFLEPFANHLRTCGLGSASEIFDGGAPFTPRGCIAQAWTVAELLRAWTATASAAAAEREHLAARGEQANRTLGAAPQHKDQPRAVTEVRMA